MKRCGMKVNVKLDINDVERKKLASYIDEDQGKRLATRKDVNNFVQGCIDAAVDAVVIKTLPAEDIEIARLRKLGLDDSYIRGWLQVGRGRQETSKTT